MEYPRPSRFPRAFLREKGRAPRAPFVTKPLGEVPKHYKASRAIPTGSREAPAGRESTRDKRKTTQEHRAASALRLVCLFRPGSEPVRDFATGATIPMLKVW